MRGHLKTEINEVEECFGGAPIHSIVRQSSSHPNHTPDCLVALLTYSDADVNLLDKQGHTPLHNAVEVAMSNHHTHLFLYLRLLSYNSQYLDFHHCTLSMYMLSVIFAVRWTTSSVSKFCWHLEQNPMLSTETIIHLLT